MKRGSKLLKPFTKAQFNRLSPAKRRLLIAQDVLAQLDMKTYVAQAGTYFDLYTKHQDQIEAEYFSGDDANSKDPLFDLLHSKQVAKCHVCAAGAACLSGARLFDQAKYITHGRDKDLMMDETVHQYFPKDMRWRMENWFENSDGDADWSGLPADKRLRFIYQQIVDNKGVYFSPATDGFRWWWKYVPAKAAKLAKVKKAEQELEQVNTELAKADQLRERLADRQAELEDLIEGV